MIVAVHMQISTGTGAVCVLAMLAALAVPRSAAGQAQGAGGGTRSPRSTEVFGGYSYLHDPGSSVLTATVGDDSFPLGWSAGVAQPVWRAVAAVGEVSGQYKTHTTLDGDVKLSFHALMAGPRAAATIGRVGEFAQVLAGAVHAQGSGFGTTVSVTAFAVQPGGGVDYALGSRFAARLELDYRWIQGSQEGRGADSQFRLVVALVYR
jgi:hypothetical protein